MSKKNEGLLAPPLPNLTAPYRAPARQARPYQAQPYRAAPDHTIPLPQNVFHKGMSLLMTVMAQGFKIAWVVSSTLRQLQNVMAMSFNVLGLLFAILTDSLVALINELLKRSPYFYGQSSVPLESKPWKFIYCEMFSHTSPRRTRPDPTVPDLTVPDLALPCLTLTLEDNLTLPHLTLPHQTRPHLTTPDLSSPDPTVPNRAGALPQNLLLNLKLGDHKSTELGAKVTDSNSPTGKGQDFVNHVRGDLVINNGYLKVKFPAGLKTRAHPNDPRSLNNDRASINIKRLISIIIKGFGGLDSVGDFIRSTKDISLKQIFVRFSSLALDFVPGCGLSHAAIKVRGGLKDFAFSVDVKSGLPFLGIVLFTRLYLPTLAHISKVGDRESVLHQWGHTLNLNINSIHYFFLSLANRVKYSSIARRICSETLNSFRASRASFCLLVIKILMRFICSLYSKQAYLSNVATVGIR